MNDLFDPIPHSIKDQGGEMDFNEELKARMGNRRKNEKGRTLDKLIPSDQERPLTSEDFKDDMSPVSHHLGFIERKAKPKAQFRHFFRYGL